MTRKHYAWLIAAVASVGFLGCESDTIPRPEGLDDKICVPGCKDGEVCKNGVCEAQGGSEVACERDAECPSGKCEAGVCVPAQVETCSAEKPCSSGVCVDGKCQATGTGEGAPGDACKSTSECGNMMLCQSGQCITQVELGGDCTGEFASCASGVCEEGKCFANAMADRDTDGDTISDYYDRCDVDTDGDGTPDCEDLDSDGDTIPDAIEGQTGGDLHNAPIDSNDDGVYDFLSLDSDGNGIPDSVEVGPDPENPVDTDGDTIPDYRSEDNDGDMMSDVEEIAGLMGSNGQPGRLCDGVPCEAGTPENPWDTDGDTIPDYMSPDSDGDTIPDVLEGYSDSDGDGHYDRYSLDSDGDTIPDAEEKDLTYTMPGGTKRYCFQHADCDADGVLDPHEPTCNGMSGVTNPDTDGDGYPDASELAAGEYAKNHGLLNGSPVSDAQALVCDPALGVQDVFEFYFELPFGGDKKDDLLLFTPQVSKLDLVFNVDTTGSMGGTINNVKSNVTGIINNVRGMVSDSGFALTNFDDFPVNGYGYEIFNGTYYRDRPFHLLGTVSTDATTVTNYTKNSLFTTRAGADWEESGAESLYQIATGAGVSWNGGSVPARTNAPNTWGGVDFRTGTLPVVVHATDAASHDYNKASYSSSYVYSPHYTNVLLPELKNKGIRVITLNVGDADRYGQMTTWAKESNAIVPACAFNGACGANKCCLGSLSESGQTLNGKPDQCILRYKGTGDSVSTYISQGVDALVKYGTYEVSTRIAGESIPGKPYGTECFIKQVVATEYIAPPEEPEKSCNPVAVPTSVGGATYQNGFSNFAPGTSSVGKTGAQLTFTVIAQNDSCVEATDKAQVFTAYIDVVNPTTGLSFGRRQVSIIVPASQGNQVN